MQNLRKDKGYEVTDRIELKVQNHAAIRPSLLNNKDYICAEILAASLDLVDRLEGDNADEVEVDDNIQTRVQIRRHTPGQVN